MDTKKNILEMNEQQKKWLEEYGFYVHNVFPSSDDEILWNHHTHGLKECFNHTDLEIVLPIHPQMAGGIFHGMVNLIKKGESFENKIMSDKVIQNYNVQLFRVNDGTRDLIRIILPDENGKFPSDKGCADVYKNQLDDLDFCKPSSLN